MDSVLEIFTKDEPTDLKEVIHTETDRREKRNHYKHPKIGQDKHEAIFFDMPQSTEDNANNRHRV